MIKTPLCRLLRISLLWLMLATPLAAQSPASFISADGGARPLSPSQAFKVTTSREANGTVDVHLDIAKGYHLYRDRLTAMTRSGAALKIDSPPGVIEEDPNFGRIEVWRRPVSAKVLSHGGPLVLHWQGCKDAGVCYPPQSRVISATQGVAPVSNAQTKANNNSGGFEATQQAGLVDGLLSRGGIALMILAFFGFGMLLAFTPCVLPMVPVVAGMLAVRGEKLTPGRGAALTGAYVLAVALAFAGLGLVAAISGRNLQVALQSPIVIWLVTALFVVLALGSFGVFELQTPGTITRRLSGPSRRRGTLPGAFALGLTSALVIGPCVTAPLAGALLYIGQTGNALLGAAALFALGLGQGVPLMAVGVFGSAVLPRMGPWMGRVRDLFGFVFLAMAVWMAGRVLPGPFELALWACLLIVSGVFLGAIDRLPPRAAPGRRLSTAAGLGALLLATLQGVGAASGATNFWRPLARFGGETPTVPAAPTRTSAHVSSPAELRRALAKVNGPALIYVTAGWCASCQEIEHKVLPQPAVQAALKKVTPIEVDLTQFTSRKKALLNQLGSVGPPTYVFLDADHQEVPGTRLVGDFGAAKLIASLRKVTR